MPPTEPFQTQSIACVEGHASGHWSCPSWELAEEDVDTVDHSPVYHQHFQHSSYSVVKNLQSFRHTFEASVLSHHFDMAFGPKIHLVAGWTHQIQNPMSPMLLCSFGCRTSLFGSTCGLSDCWKCSSLSFWYRVWSGIAWFADVSWWYAAIC